MTTLNITLGAANFIADKAPVIEINPTTIYHVRGYNYKEYGVTCYHTMGTERRVLKPTMSPTINNTTPVGTYNITYSMKNDMGTTTATRIIILVRQPTIAMVGSSSITRYVGEPLNDPGYTFDIKGIMIEPEIVLTNSPPIDEYRNLKTVGKYRVTYTMSYGIKIPTFVNQTFTRVIDVKSKKPTITVNPTVVYWKQGVTYDDNLSGVSGNPVTTDTISVTTNPLNLATITGTVNTKKDIIYTATNERGDSATATRVVRFIQQPTVTLKGSTPMNVKTGDIWVDPGYTAKDAFGVTSYEVGITGVPVLDIENRMVTPGTYTVTYTLRVSNTPNTQITSVVVETRTVNVVNPSNPPVLTVTPKRVYHRHLDAYTDTGVSAKTYLNVTINPGNTSGTLQTTSVTRKYDGNSTTVNIGDIGLLIGEYTITYEVTDNGITLKDTRYVDVYSDLLDSNNFDSTPDGHGGETSTTTRSNAGVTINPHNVVSSIEVHTLPGTSVKQRIVIDKTKASCNTVNPFTFMTWVRVKGGQTTGNIVLLTTTEIQVLLNINANIGDYFNGIQSTQINATLYGQVWSDSYMKDLDPGYTIKISNPQNLQDSGRGIITNMHDCPRLDEWLWVSVQYDGYNTYIMSINGARFEHNTLYRNKIPGINGVTVANSISTLMKFDICNTRFIYRFLHIHEIQALYEDFVLSNTDLVAKYNAFDAQLDVVNAYIDKFTIGAKIGTNTLGDDTAFESALRNIRIIGHCAFQKEDGLHLKKALDIIKKFETNHGPLFVGPNNTYWDTKVGSLYQLDTYSYGFCPYQHSSAQDQSKQLNTHRLARGMIFFQHIVWDAGLQACSTYKQYDVSSEYPISFASSLRTKKLQDVAETAKWGTATYIKGQTANVTAPAEELSIKLKIRNRPVKGIKGDYFSAPQIRCTGMWVNNGVIAYVTVPEIIINKGIQLCIGANMNNPGILEGGQPEGRHGRLDRSSTFFLVDRSTVRVYNPLGGNIYVLVPYGVNIGMITLTAKNVVRSRMFRMINDDITGFHHTTSNAEWNAALPMVDVTNSKLTLATAGPPTVDIETDYVLLHIPSQWIEENIEKHKWLTEYVSADFPATWTIYDRIKDLAMKYNSICKNIMIFRGMIGGLDVVGAIDHPMFYNSVDMVMRTGAGGVGWPMVNGPLIADVHVNKHVMNWCVDAIVSWHELAHMYCNRALAFSNEGESAIEFLSVCLLNQTCGNDLDSAYSFESNYGENSMGLDESVVDWMKEDLFVNGNYMSYNYAGYQKRSWHKYADIVALVGWDGFYAYQRAENEAWEENLKLITPKTFHTLCTDTNRIVRMTLALGIDIFPLLEFWGITDPNPANQTTFRTNVRTIIERDLMGKKSPYFVSYGPSDLQQTCVVHKCRGIRTLLLYFKSLIPKTNKEALEYVWKSWKNAYPVSPGIETLKMTNASPTDKYLGWWEKFFITDNKKWDSAKISAIEARIDQILADHGLTTEPVAVSGCIACANNKPNFNPTPKMDPSWAIMPTKSRINPIPYSSLTFYITEDAVGFIVKGERDHMGSLPVGKKMPILYLRIPSKILFYVSTITPFYIMKNNGTKAPISEVKNQGITNGLLIWKYSDRYTENSYYGKLGVSVGSYKNQIIKVFGPV